MLQSSRCESPPLHLDSTITGKLFGDSRFSCLPYMDSRADRGASGSHDGSTLEMVGELDVSAGCVGFCRRSPARSANCRSGPLSDPLPLHASRGPYYLLQPGVCGSREVY